MWAPIVLLVISNVFMTFAWYGHLKYCFQVPANRLGSEVYSVTQLKTIQEVITLSVFAVFAIFYFGESFRWNHLVGFVLLVGASFFLFYNFKKV